MNFKVRLWFLFLFFKDLVVQDLCPLPQINLPYFAFLDVYSIWAFKCVNLTIFKENGPWSRVIARAILIKKLIGESS